MITIRRGTTNAFVVVLTDEEGNPYVISDGDTVIFGVKRSIREKGYLFSKSITEYDKANGGYVISLVPEDTQELEFRDYVYDVGLQKSTGEFYIVCPCDTFTIADAVTEAV